jgi:hypothetical protein
MKTSNAQRHGASFMFQEIAMKSSKAKRSGHGKSGFLKRTDSGGEETKLKHGPR